jgi:hypothetical protein
LRLVSCGKIARKRPVGGLEVFEERFVDILGVFRPVGGQMLLRDDAACEAIFDKLEKFKTFSEANISEILHIDGCHSG